MNRCRPILPTYPIPWSLPLLILLLNLLLIPLSIDPPPVFAQGSLPDLARPMEGRSMHATSTMRQGEVRRGGEEFRRNPQAEPRGDLTEPSNWDNFRVAPGETHVLLDAQGPGVITHLWITFLGPEPHAWAKQGSANHQEMLLRMFWDGHARPAVEAPLGDFFANCFGRRSEVVSLPVVVEDADSYNCFWHMPFQIDRMEPLRLLLNMTTSYDFGRYLATLNGVKLGDVLDCYSAEIKNREFHLLD